MTHGSRRRAIERPWLDAGNEHLRCSKPVPNRENGRPDRCRLAAAKDGLCRLHLRRRTGAAETIVGRGRGAMIMGAHIINGEFQSDKYPTCPAGKVPLSVKDKTAQDLLWEYAQRRRAVDAEFSDDLETALTAAGYCPPASSPAPTQPPCENCGRPSGGRSRRAGGAMRFTCSTECCVAIETREDM